MRRITTKLMAIAATAALTLTACGDADPSVEDDAVPTPTEMTAATALPTEMEDMATADPSEIEDMADGMVENLEEQQAAEGGGHATFTAGDQTWDFDAVLCAFGEDEIGQEGAEFVLSSVQDGLQLYLSIDSFGHTMSLNDVKDFENPSVALSELPTDSEFLILDGKNVTGEAALYDEGDDTLTEIPGTVEATCP